MKAILILDEMPKICDGCQLRKHDMCYGKKLPYRGLQQPRKWDGTEHYNYRDKDCPLIEINDNIAKLIEVAR